MDEIEEETGNRQAKRGKFIVKSEVKVLCNNSTFFYGKFLLWQ